MHAPRVSACILVWLAATLSVAAGQTVFQSNSALVVLPVTVTDAHGALVGGLNAADFQIRENGKIQTIHSFEERDVPLTAGLVIDDSGSMAPNRAEVLAAARDFLAVGNPSDQFFVVNFNEHAVLGLPSETAFTRDPALLEAAVERGPRQGMTALYDATALGLEQVVQGSGDKRALVVVSDGADNASHLTLSEVVKQALMANVIVYAVGIGRGRDASDDDDLDRGALRRLAGETGGTAFFPDGAGALPPICTRIGRELRSQYMLSYAPSDGRRDGAYRAIKVTVHSPAGHALEVRTRAGYYPPR